MSRFQHLSHYTWQNATYRSGPPRGRRRAQWRPPATCYLGRLLKVTFEINRPCNRKLESSTLDQQWWNISQQLVWHNVSIYSDHLALSWNTCMHWLCAVHFLRKHATVTYSTALVNPRLGLEMFTISCTHFSYLFLLRSLQVSAGVFKLGYIPNIALLCQQVDHQNTTKLPSLQYIML